MYIYWRDFKKRCANFIILIKIWKYWTLFPHLRLCQLLGNITDQPDMYYIENEKVIELLEKSYGG